MAERSLFMFSQEFIGPAANSFFPPTCFNFGKLEDEVQWQRMAESNVSQVCDSLCYQTPIK
jgi:hypothetical protein